MKHLRFTALILALAMLLGLFPAAWAEEDAGEYSAPVEEFVGEAADLGDTGLVPDAGEFTEEIYQILPEVDLIEVTSDAIPMAPGEDWNGEYAVSAPITTNGYTVDNGTLVSWSGDSTTLSIPDSLGITVIGAGCFKDNSALTSITLPNGVFNIGDSAFAGCSALTSIVLPSSLTSIGANAFANCTALQSIMIPKGVSTIDSTAFSGCSSLTVGVFDGSKALAFCSDNSISYTVVEDVPVQGVQLASSSHSMKLGETWELVAKVIPANATDTAVSWSSSDETVAAVNNGKVKALKVGTAIISAVSAADASKTAICTVKVSEGVDVTNIILSQSGLTLPVGESAALTAAVLPTSATKSDVKWTSSDTAVATVSDGVITGVKAGTASITVSAVSDATKAASCVVTVVDGGVAVTGVSLDESSLSLTTGETWKLTASVQPDGAANTGVVWSSSDSSVASIAGGVVTARKAGSAVISIASAADATKTAACTVTVSDGTPVTSVTISQATLTLAVNASATLSATVLPADATNKKLVWSSSDTSVATVKDGLVTAVQEGTATITVTSASNGDRSDSCEVTVVSKVVPVSGVMLDKSMLSLKAGETWKLAATVLPEDASNTAIAWASSDESVLSVSGGLVTPLKEGSATVTATSAADPTMSAACVITVVNPVAVSGLSLDKTELALNSGSTATLAASVAPENASNKSVSWSSSDTTVATVSRTGVVTAYKAGKAVITATSVANVSASASCTVTVSNPVPVTTVYLSQYDLALNVKGTATLTAAILPEDATNTTLVWTSSDTDIATVKDGVVTAVREGIASITVASTSDSNIAAICTVTVSKDAVAVTGVNITHTSAVMNTGDVLKINGSVLPENASNTALTWASSDTTVATVNSGVITALKPGEATIFATSAADPSKSASCAVTVAAGTLVSEVSLSQDTLTLTPNTSATLVASVLPADATSSKLAWASSNPEIATVKNGVITALKAGVTTITAAAVSNSEVYSSCEVTVVESTSGSAITGITLSSEAIGVVVGGDTARLKATVSPADAVNTALTWASSDESIATIRGGVITGHKAGYATITVTSASGAVRAACTVGVYDPIRVEGISLSQTELSLYAGQNYQLTSTLIPENATFNKVLWTSDNPAVATVQDGSVTAVAAGVAHITVTSKSYPDYTATCTVTVPSGIRVLAVEIPRQLTMNLGEVTSIIPQVVPENATDKTVGWWSDNTAVVTAQPGGILTAVGAGQAKVYASSVMNPDVYNYCVVTVNAIPRLALNNKGSNGTMVLAVGEQLQLIPQFAYNNGWTVTSVTSSKSRVATVDGTGLVSTLSEGSATITMRTANKKKAKIKIKVVDPYKPVAVGIAQGKTYVMKVGQTLQLDPVLAPATAMTTFSWSSSRTKRATVSPTGLVTALQKGSVTITVRTANKKKAKIKIKVVE